jgi:cobalt-zinc-cadmium efflux system outer membrane protein
MLRSPRAHRALLFAIALLLPLVSTLAAIAPAARADVVPAAVELPSLLTLDDAIRIFRQRGLELLIAEAAVQSAEGDVHSAGMIPNPSVSLGYGRAFGYDASQCSTCSANTYAVSLSDSAAIEDSLSGKRSLRIRVARAALAAVKMQRSDAQRQLEFQIKAAYAQVALARASLDFAKEIQASNVKTLALNKLRYPDVIDEGALARIETQKLESDQQVDLADQTLRITRVNLAFLMGVRGRVPNFDVEKDLLKYAVPGSLAVASEESLMKSAIEHRPDLRVLAYQKARAEAAIALARRNRFPDISFSVGYTMTGTGDGASNPGPGNTSSIQPPTIMFGLSAPIPIFYQQQGEIRRAEADYNTQSLLYAKTTAQVVSDVSLGWATFTSAKRLVERMETGGLLERAKKARDIVDVQFKAGAAKLIDLLDAQRTFIATNLEYLQDLTSYWTAIYQLEQAVGVELRK